MQLCNLSKRALIKGGADNGGGADGGEILLGGDEGILVAVVLINIS